MSFLEKFFYMIGKSMRPIVQRKFDETNPEQGKWYAKRLEEVEVSEKESRNWWEKISVNLNLVSAILYFLFIYIFVVAGTFFYVWINTTSSTPSFELAEIFTTSLIAMIPISALLIFAPNLLLIILLIIFFLLLILLMFG